MASVSERRDDRVFDCVTHREDGVLTIDLTGEFDLAAMDGARSSFLDVVGDEDRVVIVDLSKLSFMDSTGLRALIDLKRRVDGRKGRLLLAGLSAPVQRVLSVSGLISWFEYADGAAPITARCPICDQDVLDGADQCLHCGSVF